MEFQLKFKVNDNLYLKDPENSEIGKSILTHAIELIYETGFERFTFKKLALKISSRRRRSFLPKLDFTYIFFNKEKYKPDYVPLFDNNFQYGLKLEIPIFLRQARADYQIAKLKISQNQQDFQFKTREISTKIETYKNEVSNYLTQIDISTKKF